MTTTQALSAELPTVGGALPVSDSCWLASVVNVGLQQGLLKFVLPGEPHIYHVDRDLVDTWENLTRTVADKFQIELAVVYDMFNDRVEAESWHRISRTCPFAFGCFKVTGEPVLSNTLYTACFRFLPGVSIKFRLPRIASLTRAQLREIIIGFVGALRRLWGAPNISADLLRCMDLDGINQREFNRGGFLKDTIWVIAEQGSVAELEGTENADCHVADEDKPATGLNDQELQRTYIAIAITQEWRPCHRYRETCPTTIEQILLPGSTLIDEIQQMVTDGFDATEENMRFTATSVEMLTYVDGQWVQIPDTQWRLEHFEGPVRAVLTYSQEW
ncbi:hypothetical protein FN846DRAFT_913370 [Sphaerosporella brunnea]|uniref:Uncharacterized protein n=1 Tax=Sphaerosporella brunnea TaxID=1250544 RepID=A0A5J5EGW9_9PEZI|nr:hypothetical protein FN846DRAFT_913370 [Sphaerosporella brunnea]